MQTVAEADIWEHFGHLVVEAWIDGADLPGALCAEPRAAGPSTSKARSRVSPRNAAVVRSRVRELADAEPNPRIKAMAEERSRST